MHTCCIKSKSIDQYHDSISVDNDIGHEVPDDWDASARSLPTANNITSSNAPRTAKKRAVQKTQSAKPPPMKAKSVMVLTRAFHTYHAGFSKCGTTSFLSWFQDHPELTTTPTEAEITRGDLRLALKQILRIYATYAIRGKAVRVAAKYPSAIYGASGMKLLRTHFPDTRVIVGIRHPIEWFYSFYNFRMIDKPTEELLPHASELIGDCIVDDHVCTEHSRFHYYLAQAFGRTPMNTSEELSLLFGDSKKGGPLPYTFSRNPSPNPVFFYEVGQLADSNATRSEIFRRDLANFLGLRETFPKAPKVKPQHLVRPRQQKERAPHTIKDFCLPEFRDVRKELLKNARDVADWIQHYFLSVDSHVVVSSPDFVRDLMQTYRHDPFNCNDYEPGR